jgi:hypothetical protein
VRLPYSNLHHLQLFFLFPGALGDVDGDGTLDYVSVSSASAVVSDGHGLYLRNKYMVKVKVVHAETAAASAVKSGLTTSIKPFIAESIHPDGSKEKLSDLHFEKVENQFWAGYMGSRGDSVYPSREKKT